MGLRNKLWWFAGLLLIAAAFLIFGHREEQVRLLYATAGESPADPAALENFRQSPIAILALDAAPLDRVSARALRSYDAVYLDVSLQGSGLLAGRAEDLRQYVRRGGHLFVEQELFGELPLDLLGAGALRELAAPLAEPRFEFPPVGRNVQSVQEVYRLFADNFLAHIGMNALPGYRWGQGLVPDGAETVVSMNGQPLVTLHRLGAGTVFATAGFLPNRYFVTGFDLTGGMDSERGFGQLAEAAKDKSARPGVLYFDKSRIPQEPYFHFAFAAANHLYRSEYVAFVSKEKLGYSVKKTLGPYGRPAMAYQNHFEAMSAFKNREGIQWAELLKEKNQLPSFSLVRSAFEWWRWQENVIVHLNEGSSDAPRFAGELANSGYGSGVRLSGEDGPFALAVYPEAKTLADPLELPYRAAPALADLTGDGRPELIAGSADGGVYAGVNLGADDSAGGVYAGQPLPEGVAPPDRFGRPQPLRLPSGEPLQAGGYAAVAALDADGDGRPDLVIGRGDGTLALALGQGGLVFAAPQPLIAGGRPARVPSFAAPVIGDIDGDGRPDLVVGDGDGGVHLFRGLAGAPGAGAAAAEAAWDGGELLFRLGARFAAPSVRDMNGDGRPDLVVGNAEGDLQVYIRNGDGWSAQGPIEGATVNQLGSRALVGGHNSVPLWYDINHDGRDDLIVGQAEYGLSVPLDDPAFPYREQLQEFLDYARDHRLELYPHLYFHNYASAEQERREIELHRRTFEALGLPWRETGTNQHTWRINNPDRLQTLTNERDAGIWFNFGFKPSHVPSDPQWGPDYIWGVPFLLQTGAADIPPERPMLVHTPAPTLRLGGPYSTEDIYRSMVALDLPIDYFEHIEYHFPGRVRELTTFVDFFDGIRTEHDYNFMSEPQMARAFLTALTGRVHVERNWLRLAVDRLKDAIGRGEHLTLRLRADARDVPAQAAEYRDTLGVVIEPGEKYWDHPLFAADADIYTKRDRKLYVGLNRDALVRISWADEPMHLIRANVPVDIRKDGGVWTIELKSPGMQQFKVYSPAALTMEGADVAIERDAEARTYTVTHFGDPVAVTLRPESPE